MPATRLKKISHTKRRGAALIIMVLLIVVLCTIIWLDPMALIKGSDADMPWNEEHRLVKADEEVPRPIQQQPEILDNMVFRAEAAQDGKARGKIQLFLSTNGRIRGGWGGEYKPKPEITWEVVSAGFKGNIDPSKIYSDENGEDLTKLYFITKGRCIILETNSETHITRTRKGRIYVTGWLDREYNAVGEIIITSDKKSYRAYSWQDKGTKDEVIPDFGKSPFKALF